MILVSRRTVLPAGVRPAAVAVAGETIVAVEEPDRVDELRRHLVSRYRRDADSEAGAGRAAIDEVVDVGELALLPGAVDSHVHVNEPGRSDWEGFETATRAAAAGGVTTIVDMPLNCSPVTTDSEALARKLAAAQGAATVDFALWGGIVGTGSPDDRGSDEGVRGRIEGLYRTGVPGFKCFTCDSGLEEFPPVGEGRLARALPVLSELGSVLLAHAEDPQVLAEAAEASGLEASPRRYGAYLASRPPLAEVRAIEMLLRLCREHDVRLHVVHLAAAEALPLLSRGRGEGVDVTVETCPHYLTFAAGEVPDGATSYKCAPPIRERSAREALWRGLREGTIDMVVSDHSPCPPEMKHLDSGDFGRAWGGIASLQICPAALWTEASRRGFGLSDLARWTSSAPARLARLDDRKGAVAPGRDGDLVVFDPDATFTVEPSLLHHRHPVTPYEGRRLRGRVVTTYLRGRPVYDAGEFVGPPSGSYLPVGGPVGE